MTDNLGNIVSGDTLHPLLQLAMASQAVPTTARPIPATAPPQGFFTTSRGDFAPATFTPPQQAPLPPPVQVATRPDIPPLQPAQPAKPAPPPPMPKPTPDTRPDLPGQPGAKEPDHTQWGVSHSPLQDLVTRVTKHLDEQQPIPPPVLAEIPRPVSQQVQNSWMSTVLSSAGLLLAAFGSRRSAAPMTAAIKSFGGYLEGYQQGQEEVWKQKQAEYKEQLDYALQRNQLELDRYKVAVEASKGDTDKLHEMLYAASILNEDERGKAELEQGRTSEFFKYVDAKQKWWDQVTAIRDKERLLGITLPEPPEPELPEDLRGYIFGGGGGGAGGGGALDIVRHVESSGDWKVTGPTTDSGPARGGYQITDGTWKQYAPPDVQRKWPTADQAPPEVQTEIAKTIPVSRWDPKTRAILHRRFGDFDENQTLGDLEKQHPGGGAQVAGPGGGTTPQPAASGQVAEDSPVAQLGRQIFRGEQPPAGTDKDEEAYASTYAQNLQKQLSAVATSGLKGQALIDAVRKIDPDTADRLPAIVANKEPLTGTDSYSNSLATIASKLKPGWTRGQYKTREDLREYFNKGPPGQVMQRAGGLASAAARVLKAINNLPTKNETVITSALKELYSYGVTGDPAFYDLATALQAYDVESVAVQLQGAPRVSLIQSLTRLTPGHASQPALRQVLLTSLGDDAGKIKSQVGRYKANFPDEGDPPMLDTDGETAIDQVLQHMDIDTGYIDLPSDQLSPLLQVAQPHVREVQ